jgi:hypothetical protein
MTATHTQGSVPIVCYAIPGVRPDITYPFSNKSQTPLTSLAFPMPVAPVGPLTSFSTQLPDVVQSVAAPLGPPAALPSGSSSTNGETGGDNHQQKLANDGIVQAAVTDVSSNAWQDMCEMVSWSSSFMMKY